MLRRLFDSSAVKGGVEAIPRGASVAPTIWRENLNEPVQEMAKRYHLDSWTELKDKLSIDASRLGHPETLAVLFDYSFPYARLLQHTDRFPPEWRAKDEDTLLGELLRNYLSPKSIVTERVTE